MKKVLSLLFILFIVVYFVPVSFADDATVDTKQVIELKLQLASEQIARANLQLQMFKIQYKEVKDFITQKTNEAQAYRVQLDALNKPQQQEEDKTSVK